MLISGFFQSNKLSIRSACSKSQLHFSRKRKRKQSFSKPSLLEGNWRTLVINSTRFRKGTAYVKRGHFRVLVSARSANLQLLMASGHDILYSLCLHIKTCDCIYTTTATIYIGAIENLLILFTSHFFDMTLPGISLALGMRTRSP
jgi:hypothetical protein